MGISGIFAMGGGCGYDDYYHKSRYYKHGYKDHYYKHYYKGGYGYGKYHYGYYDKCCDNGNGGLLGILG